MKTISALRRTFDFRDLTLFIVTVVVILFFFSIKPTYLSASNIRSIMYAMSSTGMICVGMTVLLICGEVDLASGAEAMLGGVVCGLCLRAGMPIPVAILFAVAFGAAAGLVNAFLVNVLNLMSFIATIGMSSVYGGIGTFVTKGTGINLSGEFLLLGSTTLFNLIPVPFIITVILLIIYGFILHYTNIGRTVYMVGGNRTAARLAGINSKRLTTLAFINNGIICALAGVLLASRMHVASPYAASTGALDAITAAVLGGVSFFGGGGGMGGCFVGILLLNAFTNGLNSIGVTTDYQMVAQGVLLIAAISISYFAEQRRKRKLLGYTKGT